VALALPRSPAAKLLAKYEEAGSDVVKTWQFLIGLEESALMKEIEAIETAAEDARSGSGVGG